MSSVHESSCTSGIYSKDLVKHATGSAEVSSRLLFNVLGILHEIQSTKGFIVKTNIVFLSKMYTG